MLKLINDCYETLQPYIPGKPVKETEREFGISNAIKLASNENPLGPSPKAVEAMRQALTQVHDYPDGGAFYLKQALAQKLNVRSEQLIMGNGSNEIIDLLVRTCMRPGENMLYAAGSFIAYKLAADAMGCEVRTVPLTADLGYDLPALGRTADDRTKLVFIGNPNNPTGTYVNASALEAFFEAIPKDVLVVLDEAYFEYVRANDYPNGLHYLNRRERLVVLRTFSKCYGLAGVRVGYGVADPKLIDYLNRGRLPFNVNLLGQVGALAALDDDEHLERTVKTNAAEMQRVVLGLRQHGLRVTDSQANFILVDFLRSSDDVFKDLLLQGVIVRPMGGYGFKNCVRITIGSPEQNERLLASVDRILT